MTSKLVEVPKSTTIDGPPYSVNAARVLAMRSAPTSFGLSISTGTPVLRARLDDDVRHVP